MREAKGRHEPYTALGIKRFRCARAGCDNRAHYQWQICSDGNTYRPLCIACDVAMNRLVLEFMGDPDRAAKLKAYESRDHG